MWKIALRRTGEVQGAELWMSNAEYHHRGHGEQVLFSRSFTHPEMSDAAHCSSGQARSEVQELLPE